MSRLHQALTVVLPGALATAVVVLLVDAWRAMKAGRACPLVSPSQDDERRAYLAQLAPTENEILVSPALATTTSTVTMALTDAQKAAFDANVTAVARFAQRQRKCVRLDTSALSSVSLVDRAVAILRRCPLVGGDAGGADSSSVAPRWPARSVLSGLLCRGTHELLMWATRLQHDLAQPPAMEGECLPLVLMLTTVPTSPDDLERFFLACSTARGGEASLGRPRDEQPPALSCACVLSTLAQLDALQALLATQTAATLHGAEEMTLLLDVDLTYHTAARTVNAAKRVYRWGLRRTQHAPPLRTPADVMLAQSRVAEWNHAQNQSTDKEHVPFLGLAGFLLGSRRTAGNRRDVLPLRERHFGYYLRQTLARWGTWLGWIALHSPFLYPLVRLVRRRAHRDAVARVVEVVQWYIFGCSSFADERIHGPRPPGSSAMAAEEGGAALSQSAWFRVIEEEDLYVIDEGLPVLWQRPTADEMRDLGGAVREGNSNGSPTSPSGAPEERVIPLMTDEERRIVVEYTVGAKTLCRGLSATIPGLKELQ